MKCSGRFKFTILFICSLLGYTTSSLSFFLVHRAKRAGRVNDHARGWRRETGEARKKRVTLFSSRAAALVSRVSRLRRSRKRTLPPLNLKKCETASSLFHLPQDAVDGLVTMTSGAFELESWFAWNGSDVKSICVSKQWVNTVHMKVVYFVLFDFFINGLICQVILEIEWTTIQWRQ